MDKIKAVVLDVDGVINGSLDGINTPMPHSSVIKAMQQIAKNNIPIIFCTSKAIFPIQEMVEEYNLGGLHIIDGGAIIYDGNKNKVEVDAIDKGSVKQLIKNLESEENYFEVYTDTDWFVLDRFDNQYLKNHTELLRKEPTRVKAFNNLDELNVSKLIYFTEDKIDSESTKAIIANFPTGLDYKWTSSPVLKPANLLIITKSGVSKKNALENILKNLNIEPANALGVGDNESDWGFMEICGFVGAMGNSSRELMDLVKQKSKDSFVIGGDVDENGVLDIFKHFELI